MSQRAAIIFLASFAVFLAVIATPLSVEAKPETAVPPASTTITVSAADFPLNPVAASEKDDTLAGADADGNDVRDDVDAFIASRYPNPQERAVATTYAVAMTKMMLAANPKASLAADKLVGA